MHRTTEHVFAQRATRDSSCSCLLPAAMLSSEAHVASRSVGGPAPKAHGSALFPEKRQYFQIRSLLCVLYTPAKDPGEWGTCLYISVSCPN